jgi:hypothetical protein
MAARMQAHRAVTADNSTTRLRRQPLDAFFHPGSIAVILQSTLQCREKREKWKSNQ